MVVELITELFMVPDRGKPVGVVGRISAVAADTERIRFHQFGSEPGSARTVQYCIDAVIDISYGDYYSLKHWVEVVSYGESDCDWTCQDNKCQ